MRDRNAWALFSLILLLTACTAGSHAAKAMDAGPDSLVYCPDWLERLLPGDYYACRARYHLQRNHPRQAVSMLLEASYWANKDAQHALGLAYTQGDLPGTPADKPLGLAWLALAAERRNPVYLRDYAQARARCNAEEIARANEWYVQLLARYGDHVAGKRAVQRFNHEVEPFDLAAREGGVAYISGFSPVPQSAMVLSRQLHTEAEGDFSGLQGTVTVGALRRASGLADDEGHH